MSTTTYHNLAHHLSSIDDNLWKECQEVIPKLRPDYLPYEIGTIDGDIKVKLVDGDRVKIEHFMDFIEGGNGERYTFIPRKEIWLDNNLSLHDLPFILYHEAYERRLMSKGMSYNKAHIRANRQEKILRERAFLFHKNATEKII